MIIKCFNVFYSKKKKKAIDIAVYRKLHKINKSYFGADLIVMKTSKNCLKIYIIYFSISD